MADRAWAFVPDPQHRSRSGIRIECAECGKDAFFAPNSGGRFPPKAAEIHFTRAGWEVGRGPRRDFCSDCVAKRADKQKGSNVVEMPRPKVASTEPRTMTVDDRKLIIAEIKGCWDEERERYMDGWHDDKIAQSLGAHVPRAWVREVREAWFGGNGSNDQFDEYMRKVEAAMTEIAHVQKMHKSLTEALVHTQKSVDELTVLAKEVRRSVGR